VVKQVSYSEMFLISISPLLLCNELVKLQGMF